MSLVVLTVIVIIAIPFMFSAAELILKEPTSEFITEKQYQHVRTIPCSELALQEISVDSTKLEHLRANLFKSNCHK